MSKFPIYVLYFLIIISVTTCLANNTEKKPINGIIVSGNDNTKEDVITRELLFSVGDTPSDSLLEYSKTRLLNLGLFSRVEFYYLPSDEGIDLLILVHEQLYIFPYPIFTLSDRDWEKITYGAGVTHVNFLRRNHKVNAVISFGYNPGYSFGYKIPWLGREEHYYFGLFARKFRTTNRSMNFYEHHLKFSSSLGKFWTRYFYTIVVPFYNRIKVDEADSHFMTSGTQVDERVGLSISTGYDNRDLVYYPSQGWRLSFIIEKNGLFVDYLDYWKYQVDIRKYYNFHSMILAGRISTTQSIGPLPIYDRVYLGFGERVRGHFYEVYEGRHNVIGALELLFTLINTSYYALPAPDYIPKHLLRNLKFGLNGAFFFETGEVWSNPKELKFNRLINGFGASLIARVPYAEIIRLDMAFNENFDMQWIFEVGMAF